MRTTFQQGKGRWNKDYWTALFWLDNSDKHFFIRNDKEKCNFMPKHTDITQMIEGCLEVEPPEKREKLKALFLEAINNGLNKEVKYNGNQTSLSNSGSGSGSGSN